VEKAQGEEAQEESNPPLGAIHLQQPTTATQRYNADARGNLSEDVQSLYSQMTGILLRKVVRFES